MELANHTVLIRRDGSELPIDDSAAPIRDAEGRLFGVVLVFHEISESRRLQRELMRQRDALKDADVRKDQFLAVLAHELRNPLAPLRNGLQIARMKVPSDDALKRTIEMMERQLAHLVRLVDDLMDVSRVSRGVIELRRAPVFLNSHDGTSAYQLRLGLFRAVCTNGLIVSRAALPAFYVAHRGDIVEEVVAAALRLSEQFEALAASIDRMEQRVLESAEQVCFAERALALRYPESAFSGMQPSQLLLCRREQDDGADLWRVYNRVQLCSALHN